MSDKFNGFSQDDIKKLRTNQKKIATASNATTNTKPAFRNHREGIRRVTENMQITKKQQQEQTNGEVKQQHQQQKNIKAINVASATIDDTMEEINLDHSMSKSLEEALFFQPIKKVSTTGGATSGQKSNEDIKSNDSSILHLPDNIDTSSSYLTFENSTTISDKTKDQKLADDNGTNKNMLNLDSPFKGISLKDFETHRKMIEEQNKQKKEMLHKAIEQYSLKTAAEARKIEEIKTELSKLDNDLALDVAMLRKQIDMACIHFTNMEKQYMKIETQFLKAKMDLHNAAEKKELLTEHLCTVIAHNEDRKAQKLSELMQKVGLASADDFESKELPTPSATETTDK